MQMPMPQSGPRGSPLTDNRHGSLAMTIAAATLQPAVTRTCRPLMVIEMSSLIDCVHSRRPRFLLNRRRGAKSTPRSFHYRVTSLRPA
jgi:hypothetical protein